MTAQLGEEIDRRKVILPEPIKSVGTHVYNPAISRAHLTIPHDRVRALETDLRMLVETATELKDHEALPLFLDLVDASYRELAPNWPTNTDIAQVRYVSGDAEGGNTWSVGQGDNGQPGFERILHHPLQLHDINAVMRAILPILGHHDGLGRASALGG